MVDAHCHLTDKRYGSENVGELVSSLKFVVSNGTSIEDSKRVLQLAEKHQQVWATVGVHPEEITPTSLEATLGAGNFLKELAKHPKVVAVGEAALDFYEGITEDMKNMQRILFEMHIQLAEETGLPLVVHNRNADEDILDYLEDFSNGIQLHCFVENKEYAQEAINRGWYLSYGGIITFKKSDYLREIVKLTPPELILTETDAPYLAPEPIRGTINKPENVKIVAETVANIRGATYDQVSKITEENIKKLFFRIHD